MTKTLTDRLQEAADSPSTSPDFTRMAARARRRRHTMAVTCAALVVLVAATVVVGVASNGGTHNRSEIAIGTRDGSMTPDGWTRIDLGNDKSIAVPPGWSRFSLTDPHGPMIVGVGSVDPAVTSAISACTEVGDQPSVTGTWVSVYEYPATAPGGLTTLPTGEQAVSAAFENWAVSFEEMPATGGTCKNAEFARYLFRQGDRFYLARIVTTEPDQPDATKQAVRVLDTLILHGQGPDPSATTTTVTIPESASTTAPVATLPPSDNSDDVGIRAAFTGWLGSGDRTDISAFVEDAASIADAQAEGLAQHSPADLASYAGQVDAIVMIDETHADVTYTVLHAGTPQFPRVAGHAVKIDGTWYVTRDTACNLFSYGGITCPPRTTPVP